jgi:hypothetical protein
MITRNGGIFLRILAHIPKNIILYYINLVNKLTGKYTTDHKFVGRFGYVIGMIRK